jgi:hypothetical protein
MIPPANKLFGLLPFPPPQIILGEIQRDRYSILTTDFYHSGIQKLARFIFANEKRNDLGLA